MPRQKDPALAAILGALCGGFGLFYVSVTHGFLSLIAGYLIILATGGCALPVAIAGWGVWGYIAATNHNKSLGIASPPEAPADVDVNRAPPAMQASRTPAPAHTAPRSPQASSPNCEKCNAELRPGARFCGTCGAPTSP